MTIQISNLVESLAEAIDLVSPQVDNHHRKVICVAGFLGREYGLSADRMENLIIASALHDVGALTSQDRLDILNFDETGGIHSEYGYLLLKKFRPFAPIAPIVRYHHAYWTEGARGVDGEPIPVESRIVFLADRISVLITENFSLTHTDKIVEKIQGAGGRWFQPDLVEVFLRLARKESFWLDARDAFIRPTLQVTLARNLDLDDEDLLGLGKLYSQIIDFRSSFTATHSSGVSAVAEELARLIGFSGDECLMMRLAGYLHDIGKLVVPESILEKPGRLTDEEYDVIRSHTYYSDRLLLGIREFDTIRTWGALHHERLNGKGYPFHLTGRQLPLGSRIMAVADVFVAVREDRPYRASMSQARAMAVLDGMVAAGALDGGIVAVLKSNFAGIDGKREEEQRKARQEYNEFYSRRAE